MKFTDFNLSPDILSTVVTAGFETPSPIQELTIPLALEGKDVIGQAQTGTGKTAGCFHSGCRGCDGRGASFLRSNLMSEIHHVRVFLV